MPIAIKDSHSKLTAIIEPSDSVYIASCPELDLVTEGDTTNEALSDLIEMTIDYAEQYMEEFDQFSKSPNRASHKDYILEIHQKK
ncbi:MAG TPA: hypothetical protein ENI73_00780, partial [Spirochaetes bacterium]|nr:hypothetical protein [Spirochaetota bacterium]